MQKYDVVIIGSGMGGLSAGIQLQVSKPTLKTVILEQHTIPGGYVSGFTRRGHYFDAGAEGSIYVGKNQLMDKWFQEIGFHHDFIKEEPLEVIHYPDRVITIYSDIAKYKEELYNHFPKEKKGIDKYFDYILAMTEEYIPFAPDKYKQSLWMLVKFFLKSPKILLNFKKNFDVILHRYLSDPQLHDVLSFFTLWLGMPVDKLSAVSTGVLFGYIHSRGNYYAKGGMNAFTQSLVKFYQDKGGEIRYSSLVEKVNIENGKATHVKLTDGSVISADWVISNADVKNTLLNYINEDDNLPHEYKEKIENISQSVSGFAVFIIVNKDLSYLPSHLTVKGSYKDMIQPVLDGEFNTNNVCIRIPSNIDHSLRKKDETALILLSLAPYSSVEKWSPRFNAIKNDEYKKWKEKIADELISTAEKAIPNLSDSIIYKESSSPLTFERYTLNRLGAWYGPHRNQDKVKYKTPIKNLFLAGANTCRGGVPNCLLSGIKTAKKIVKQIEAKEDK